MSWRFYLLGMWRSGLRLSESLGFYCVRNDRLIVDFDGLWLTLRISAAFEKGKRDRLLPMATEFKFDTDAESGKVEYASAHDHRRAFGNRWPKQVMPAVLKELMRNDDVSTAMKYYAEQDAQSVADVVWKSAEPQSAPPSNTAGNSCQKDGTSAAMPKTRKSHNSL